MKIYFFSNTGTDTFEGRNRNAAKKCYFILCNNFSTFLFTIKLNFFDV